MTTQVACNLKPLFPLGQTVATPGAIMALSAAGISTHELMSRHVAGDWGQVSSDDAALNDRSIGNGTRILSAYELPHGSMVWIITEADRSSTTILLPCEY